MRNNTKSEVIIEMRHIDNANQLTAALKKFKAEAGKGGDAQMYIRSNGKLISCGKVGHDVNMVKVKHTIYNITLSSPKCAYKTLGDGRSN